MPKIVNRKEVRDDFCLTTVRLIATKGLDNVSLRLVAVAHNSTKGMVQHYFADKEELLMRTWLYAEEARAGRIMAVDKRLSGLALLEAQLQAHLPTTKDIADEWRCRLAFSGQYSLTEEMRETEVTMRNARVSNGTACLRSAYRTKGILKKGDWQGSYLFLESLVTGLAVAGVMSNLSANKQRKVLATAIQKLRQ